MDISQTGSASLQSAQWQSLLAALDPTSATQSGAATSSDPFADLLQSSESLTDASSAAADGSTSSLAMLQALLGSSGTATGDPLLDALDSADGTDGTSGIFDSNFAVLEALQGASAGGSATGKANALAMLQALSNSDSSLLQAALGNGNTASSSLAAAADNDALQAYFGSGTTTDDSALLQALQSAADNGKVGA